MDLTGFWEGFESTTKAVNLPRGMSGLKGGKIGNDFDVVYRLLPYPKHS
jgi:hypothetical protein